MFQAQLHTQKRSLFPLRIFTLLIGIALTLSLTLHTYDTNHTHPKGDHQRESSNTQPYGDTNISAYTHMNEKKFLVVLPNVFLIPSALPQSLLLLVIPLVLNISTLRIQLGRPRFTLWQKLIFQDGTLHPKLY